MALNKQINNNNNNKFSEDFEQIEVFAAVFTNAPPETPRFV